MRFLCGFGGRFVQTINSMFATRRSLFVARADRSRISGFEGVYLSYGGLLGASATVFELRIRWVGYNFLVRNS